MLLSFTQTWFILGGSFDQSIFAHHMDGDKMICLDDRQLANPCLVYSFGIGNDATYEER